MKSPNTWFKTARAAPAPEARSAQTRSAQTQFAETKSAETKSAPAPSRPLVAVARTTSEPGLPGGFAGLTRLGYRRNPVVYRCVRLLAETAASVPLQGPPAARALLTATSPVSGPVMERVFGHLAVTGSAYIETVRVGDHPVALRALRPDTVETAVDGQGRAVGWHVSEGGRRRTVRFDPATHRSPILALHLFDPLGAGHGPLEACAAAVDIHNEGARWTRSLLGNAACPSGALIYRGEAGTRLSDEQFERLRSELDERHTGARAAGRPMLLEGGLDWTSMSLSPADMDFIEARREAAREIALAFGVPPMLLGIPGDNTYSNYREANVAFWRQTVLPTVARTAHALSGWLQPWGVMEGRSLAPDLDAVPALSSERDALWARLGAAEFLSDAERRSLAGLPPRRAAS